MIFGQTEGQESSEAPQLFFFLCFGCFWLLMCFAGTLFENSDESSSRLRRVGLPWATLVAWHYGSLWKNELFDGPSLYFLFFNSLFF